MPAADPPFPYYHNQHPLPFSFPEINDGDHNPLFTQRDTYDLNNKIMLTAIASLSFVVVLVIVLHVYARWVLRHRARDRAIMRSLGLTAAAHNHSGDPSKTGLDPAVIASLPIFVFKKTADQEDDGLDGLSIECAVCLSFLEDQEMARLLPNCKHTFHAECVDKWLSSNSTCPICRTEAEPRVQPLQREGPVGGAPLEGVNSTLMVCVGGSSEGGSQCCSDKAGGSGSSMSRLSSFRRILSWERSSRRLQSEVQEEGFQDLERQ